MSEAMYRLLFPLAPALAVLVLSCFDFAAPAKGMSGGMQYQASVKAAPNPALSSAGAPKLFLRAADAPKYAVKFESVNLNGVDYDAGGGIVEVACSFEDLDPERPVVGMSSQGLVMRLQTDTGALVEGLDGYGTINPEIREFKHAPFTLRAKVPLQTRSVNMLNGALTVLRARERAALNWREPFGAQVGKPRLASGFEIVLTKFETSADTAAVEWSCKPPDAAALESGLWERRQLKVVLTFADKSTAVAEAGTDTPSLLRREFRTGKKVPIALDVSFISDLCEENLPFTLTGISIDGSAEKKPSSGTAQKF